MLYLILNTNSLYYVCRAMMEIQEAEPLFLSCWRQSREVSSTHCFPPNLDWQLCHLQHAHSPMSPEDVFGSHLSFLGMWWRQQLYSNRRWWYHTATTRSFSPTSGHPAPLLQISTFSMMDNDVVALFSLLLWPCSCISCISFMHWLAFHRRLFSTSKLNSL